MKQILRWLVMGIIIFSNTDCTKVDPPGWTTNPPPPPPPPPPSNFHPPKWTVLDKLVFFPANSCMMTGGGSSWSPIATYQWRKVSGPSSFLIEDPNSGRPKVTNLDIGVYQFELTVVDANGLSDQDTCSVIVNQLPPNPSEMVLDNLQWTEGYMWGAQIIVPNVYQYLPAGSVFKAFIKRDNSATWVELIFEDPNAYYVTAFLNGNMSTWSNYDETDTPAIKLVY